MLRFDGYSRYAGLDDLRLTPIELDISATVLGLPARSVPEPTSWAMMVAGIGLVGGMMRRARRVTVGFAGSDRALHGPRRT